MDSDTRKILEERAHRLSLLQKHASWPEFKDELDRKREREKKSLHAAILGADERELARLVDNYKGFDKALKWASGVVEQAEKTLAEYLERDLRQQQIAEELNAEHR